MEKGAKLIIVVDLQGEIFYKLKGTMKISNEKGKEELDNSDNSRSEKEEEKEKGKECECGGK